MNQEDFCSYELALKLKACGFYEPCDSYYDKACASDDEYWHTKREKMYNWNGLDSDCQISAPTLAHAQKWLREKGIAVSVQANEIQGELWYSADIITTKGVNELVDGGFDYMEYETALSAGIAAALELIEQENK